MKYLTGMHALNVPCPSKTCGDWHQSAYKWETLTMGETEGSILGDYGIFLSDKVPDGNGGYRKMYVADTIRALFDLIIKNDYANAQGMREDFICNEDYTPEVFSIADKFKGTPYWEYVDYALTREYELEWLNHKNNE